MVVEALQIGCVVFLIVGGALATYLLSLVCIGLVLCLIPTWYHARIVLFRQRFVQNVVRFVPTVAEFVLLKAPRLNLSWYARVFVVFWMDVQAGRRLDVGSDMCVFFFSAHVLRWFFYRLDGCVCSRRLDF